MDKPIVILRTDRMTTTQIRVLALALGILAVTIAIIVRVFGTPTPVVHEMTLILGGYAIISSVLARR